MSGHFEKGVWIDDDRLIFTIQYPPHQYTYPDVPSQLFTITEKLAWIEQQLMVMDWEIKSMAWELRWKK